MSHIERIIGLKEELDTLGLKNTEHHKTLITEAFVRAVTSNFTRLDLPMTEFLERAWVQLDKWNCVAPLNAQLICATLCKRHNASRESLITHGVIGGGSFNTMVFEYEEGDVTVSIPDLIAFRPLVDYLIAEFKDGKE